MISLTNAQVYDCETFPNLFSLCAESLNTPEINVWEISDYRDDRHHLIAWFNWLNATGTPMIGFNNESFDYPVIHYIYTHPQCAVADIYAKAMSIIGTDDRFAHTIWPRDRFAPQIDLYRVHHFDNRAKTTSLKSLQFNMRRKSVRESRIPFGVPVSAADVDAEVIPYNKSDTGSTKEFAHYSMGAIEFRLGLVDRFGVECLSWNDTKVGEMMLEQRLGDEVCYDRSSGRKQKRQTVRWQIKLRDIIFPYVRFDNPEFQRVHAFMLDQVLSPDDAEGPGSPIRTKGVFTDLNAVVGGLRFDFGTGGVHASVEAQRFVATDEWPIRDIDVASLYPSIAIANGLAPAHLGERFIEEYAKIPAERSQHAKGTYMNAALKLAANGAWGKSNSKYSVFYDPQYAMSVPINGQLLLCMLAERLAVVPTVQMLQCNTDGITYRLHHTMFDAVKTIEKQWQDETKLTLEDAQYNRMFIADVNSYLAEHMDGKIKAKGRYWTPDALNYAESISLASPPSWHKDLSNLVSVRAAVAAMIHGVDPEAYVRACTNPYDFMLRAKVNRTDTLLLGDREMQRVTRYYVARDGAQMVKVSPPVAGGVVGAWKRANGVTAAQYDAVMRETGGAWSEKTCTKNRSKYEERRTTIQAGWRVAECNDADTFAFDNVDYSYYVQEARKLIIT